MATRPPGLEGSLGGRFRRFGVVVEEAVVGKRLAVFVAVLCVALPMWAGSAGAVRAAHAPKFVGTYRVIGDGYRDKWRLDANGDVYQVAGGAASYFGSWYNDRRTVTVSHLFTPEQTFFWVGQKTHRGISSKRNPGTFYVETHPEGTWYAIKTN